MARTTEYFEVSGRFRVVSNSKGIALKIKWIQDGENYKVRITHLSTGFYGIIEGNENRATLNLSDLKTSVRSNDPNSLVHSVFGFSFPILRMKHWILGNADPKLGWTPNGEKNSNNYSIEQDGWSIKYSSYMKSVPKDKNIGLDPKKLTLNSAGTKIKMTLKSWKFPKPTK